MKGWILRANRTQNDARLVNLTQNTIKDAK